MSTHIFFSSYKNYKLRHNYKPFYNNFIKMYYFLSFTSRLVSGTLNIQVIKICQILISKNHFVTFGSAFQLTSNGVAML